ncbi:hypothetical protein SAMN04488033_102156 [Salegentibacter agarivorans]|jgi:hypothetical protein|uniref:Uncharacterized protein n=1 Tax=Salegentibacter agarivorans TaxID=345907 RepID=A0A1I2K811_9FLAO|nr:DUF6155 family protein [Salegentibacter agarivorans]SFF63262.1 hypothetical protein SAMN04488033_102156 [Salegentibacter agarivorans]
MSKRQLKKYLQELDKEQLEEQIVNLYERFIPVKVFYDFVFNPREEELMRKAKLKISKEYFPETRRKPKARRSIAQKEIKHFQQLGVEPHLTADLMLFNIEIAQTFAEEKSNLKEAFCKSIFKSFEEAVKFILKKGVLPDFKNRILKIAAESENQSWPNAYKFEKVEMQFQDAP